MPNPDTNDGQAVDPRPAVTPPYDPVLEASPLDQLLGLRVKEATAERVVAVLPVTPKLHQNFGITHGGVYAAVAETVASGGANLALHGAGRVVGMTNHTEFLRATRSGELQVEATPLARGRTTQLWRVEITDETGRLCAHSQVRLMNLRDDG